MFYHVRGGSVLIFWLENSCPTRESNPGLLDGSTSVLASRHRGLRGVFEGFLASLLDTKVVQHFENTCARLKLSSYDKQGPTNFPGNFKFVLSFRLSFK